MAKGKIKVESENIFPVIKKFLYSDHEIFLRELVSNAVDATLKLNVLSKTGDFKGTLEGLQIEVSIDKDAGTLTVSDNGIGMTEQETKQYLNQVAFSGAEEFLKKYEGQTKDSGIIGHFGLGFYSAFMVSQKVEVQSLSYKEDSQPVKWECDGNPEYKTSKGNRTEHGTDVIIHIDDESKEFLEEDRIRGILDKYCKFLPVPIKFGMRSEWIDDPSGEKDENDQPKRIETKVENIINNPKPAWTKKPKDLSEEDYNSFYKELYPTTFEDPLFHIHLNVDHPFHLTGILYFPRLKNNIQLQKNKIQLFSNQVFITDSVENIVPEFLTLLHGVIDSPDIPLNVSRSFLQEDRQVKQISSHISKKVADKLASLFKKDRDDFASKWDDIKVFMEYGALTDEKFFDRIKKALLFKNSEGEFFTIEEYKEKIKESQTDKDGKLVHLYTNDPDGQHQFISIAKNKGYDVLVLDSPLTPHFVQFLEQKLENTSFTRVDSDSIDKLIKKEDAAESNLSEDQENELKGLLENIVDKQQYTVQFEALTENDQPLTITQPEFFRRMKEQQELGGGMMMTGNMPDMFNLVVNANHPLISKILIEQDAEKKANLAEQAVDLAKLSQNMLTGEKLTKFIQRSVALID
ncbi:MAG TPA: molecular chaperone HtpG [Flavobacteriales bacterium]|jgi:molecular chaperone HtpG|nr:molecular chaperone HtpG [Flavobacteriales bacterium]